METLTSRTAVTVARHPMWLDALGQLLTRVGVKVEGHTTSPAAGLALVQETTPDLLIVEVEASDGDLDGWQSAPLLIGSPGSHLRICLPT